MKLDQILKLVAPHLAADKKIEDVAAQILAADAAGSGLGARELEEKDQAKDKRAKDRAARDAKCIEDRKARDEKRAEDRKARDEKNAMDRKARDERNDDPEHTNDAAAMEAMDAEFMKEAEDEAKAEMEGEDEDYMSGADPSTPGGSRAGGKTTVDKAAMDTAIASAVAGERALATAKAAVATIVGDVTFDSAESAYRAGLKQLGVDTKGVHASALPTLLQIAKDKAAAASSATVTVDTAAVSEATKLIPGYGRLK